jgi:hypothetical protein
VAACAAERRGRPVADAEGRQGTRDARIREGMPEADGTAAYGREVLGLGIEEPRQTVMTDGTHASDSVR